MTSENRRFISCDEIIGIQYKCKTCGTTVSIPRERWVGPPPRQCPAGCSEDPTKLTTMIPEGLVDKNLRALMSSIQFLIAGKPDVGCTISLEIDEEQHECRHDFPGVVNCTCGWKGDPYKGNDWFAHIRAEARAKRAQSRKRSIVDALNGRTEENGKID